MRQTVSDAPMHIYEVCSTENMDFAFCVIACLHTTKYYICNIFKFRNIILKEPEVTAKKFMIN